MRTLFKRESYGIAHTVSDQQWQQEIVQGYKKAREHEEKLF